MRRGDAHQSSPRSRTLRPKASKCRRASADFSRIVQLREAESKVGQRDLAPLAAEAEEHAAEPPAAGGQQRQRQPVQQPHGEQGESRHDVDGTSRGSMRPPVRSSERSKRGGLIMAQRLRQAPCSGCNPTGTARDTSRIDTLDLAIDARRRADLAVRRQEMHVIAGPVVQALGIGEQHRRACSAPGVPPASSCRPVGRRRAPSSPSPTPGAWSGSMPTASPAFSALISLRTPPSRPAPACRLAPRPCSMIGREPVLLGPAIQHGDGLERGVVLRGDFEAAQVRRQEQDAAPGLPGLLRPVPSRSP